jgi:hypothetical protein
MRIDEMEMDLGYLDCDGNVRVSDVVDDLTASHMLDELQNYLYGLAIPRRFIIDSEELYKGLIVPLYLDITKYHPLHPLPRKRIPLNPFLDACSKIDYERILEHLDNMMTNAADSLYLTPKTNLYQFLAEFVNELVEQLDLFLTRDCYQFVRFNIERDHVIGR